MKKEHKEYLDSLRASGVVNMFEATAYLMHRFLINKREAKQILVKWMRDNNKK